MKRFSDNMVNALNFKNTAILFILCLKVLWNGRSCQNVLMTNLKELRTVKRVSKVLRKFFNFVVCNPWQSSPSLTILVPLWFIIISLVFFYLCKALFSGFPQFKGNFVDGQSNSKYRDGPPLS